MSDEDRVLCVGQLEVIDNIHAFLETESSNQTPVMLIFGCKANLDGCGISTTLRHALCAKPCNIEWVCFSQRTAVDVLQKLVPLHTAKTKWTLLKRNDRELLYTASDTSNVQYQRSASVMQNESPGCRAADVVVYDDVTLNTFDDVVKCILQRSLSPHEHHSIVALTVLEQELNAARLAIDSCKKLFTTTCDVTHWHRVNVVRPAWKADSYRARIEKLYESHVDLRSLYGVDQRASLVGGQEARLVQQMPKRLNCNKAAYDYFDVSAHTFFFTF